MRKRFFFTSVMVMVMLMVVVLVVGEEKKFDRKSTGAGAVIAGTSCVTQVPTEGTAGEPVQFRVQLQEIYTPVNPGDIASVDYIVETPVRMRYVKAGTYTQGSPESEPGRGADETQFTHILPRDIAVMETEVTIRMWAELKAFQPTLPQDPSTFDDLGMDHPVHNVTWRECILFANLLSLQKGFNPCYSYTKDGITLTIDATNYTDFDFSTKPISCNFAANGYRLPTEGEWEFFCRAGTTDQPYHIDEPQYPNYYTSCNPGVLPVLESVARFCANSNGTTQPVGSREGNNWNIKDTHGSVREWCWDGYDTYPGGTQTDYKGLNTSSQRVLRNGGWTSEIKPSYLRCASRFSAAYSSRLIEYGFRLVRTL